MSELSKDNLGNIDMKDMFTFVEVDKAHTAKMLSSLDGKQFKGRAIRMNDAEGGGRSGGRGDGRGEDRRGGDRDRNGSRGGGYGDRNSDRGGSRSGGGDRGRGGNSDRSSRGGGYSDRSSSRTTESGPSGRPRFKKD